MSSFFYCSVLHLSLLKNCIFYGLLESAFVRILNVSESKYADRISNIWQRHFKTHVYYCLPNEFVVPCELSACLLIYVPKLLGSFWKEFLENKYIFFSQIFNNNFLQEKLYFPKMMIKAIKFCLIGQFYHHNYLTCHERGERLQGIKRTFQPARFNCVRQ